MSESKTDPTKKAVEPIEFVQVDPVVAKEKGMDFATHQAVELTRARMRATKSTETKPEETTQK